MTQECPHCHHLNRDTAQFCAGCGNPLQAGGTQTYIALQPGQVMHSIYRIVRALGKGGMGAVYLVADLGAFGRQRVIKEMLQYFDMTDSHAVQKAQRRFEAEGRTLAQLRHPGIPDITAYFSESGRNYIVMEYVEGEDLLQGLTHEDAQGDLVPGKPYPAADILRWGIQLCGVLSYLARRKPPVIHHDIKPANIIIDENTDEARLVDFGTAQARLVVQPGGKVGVRKSSIYGTEGYAAPEMYRAESSPRSDVYSLAATLYHLLTDDDPRDHPLDYPKLDTLSPALRAVLQKALQNDPQQRPEAHVFRGMLQDVQAALGGAVKAPFTFPDGKQARTPRELARLCDAQWDAAKKLLYSGEVEHWLRHALFRSDLADGAASIVQSGGDQDEGLETFLHILNSRLPYPALRLRPRSLRFGRIASGDKAQRALHIRNRARRGPLKGTLTAEPPVSWLTIPPNFYGERDVTVTVNSGGVSDGTQLAARLKLKTAYEEQSIAVHGQVAFPWLRALGRMGVGLLVGGMVGGYLAFLGMNAPYTESSYVGVLVLALFLTWSCTRRTRTSWKKKWLLRLFYLLLFGALLKLINWGCYISWSSLRHVDKFASWSWPTAAGAIVGLAIGTLRALNRPGHRLVPWLFSTFILLGSAIYGGTVVSTPLVSTPVPVQEATATPHFSVSTPAHQQPTAIVRPGEIGIGIWVVVVTGDGQRLNIRRSPGTAAGIITRVEPGTQLEVLDGPRTAGGYTWWRVKSSGNTIGWAAENWLKPVE